MKKQQLGIMLGIVCFALTFSIFTQGRTVKNMKKTVGTSLNKNSDLIDEVFKSLKILFKFAFLNSLIEILFNEGEGEEGSFNLE